MHYQEDCERPEGPVGQDVQRRNVSHATPEGRGNPPHHLGAEDVEEAPPHPWSLAARTEHLHHVSLRFG